MMVRRFITTLKRGASTGKSPPFAKRRQIWGTRENLSCLRHSDGICGLTQHSARRGGLRAGLDYGVPPALGLSRFSSTRENVIFALEEFPPGLKPKMVRRFITTLKRGASTRGSSTFANVRQMWATRRNSMLLFWFDTRGAGAGAPDGKIQGLKPKNGEALYHHAKEVVAKLRSPLRGSGISPGCLGVRKSG